MSAMASDLRPFHPLRSLLALLACVWTFAAAAAEAERYLVQVLVPIAPLHEKPDADSPVIGRVEQGAQLEADAKSGEWYRVRRVGAASAWILNAPVASGPSLAIAPFPADRRLGVEAA